MEIDGDELPLFFHTMFILNAELIEIFIRRGHSWLTLSTPHSNHFFLYRLLLLIL